MSENKTPIRRINGHALVDEQARSDIEELKVGGGTGGITQETDPTVPAWAKTEEKPTYTAAEVGADPTGTATKAIDQHDVDDEAHEDIRALITGLTNRLNALANSDDTTLDQMAEVVAYIKNNKALIDQITTGKISTSDIVDNLTTNVSTKVLSAAQGVALKALIDAIVVPSTLPNPQPIVINGESYDGSVKKEITIQPGSSTSVDLDTTLAVSGKAADAKATGDAIAAEKQAREQELSELNEANAAQDNRLKALEEAGGIVTVEPAEDDVPIIFFGGDLPQTKTDTVMPFKYVSKTKTVSGYVETKAQGNSSMNYPKKNQTVKMYADEALEDSEKVDFKNWGAQKKHVYKANWIDLTHSRNIVSAQLWGDVVKSRANYLDLPELLRTSPNQGAVDGFPALVYANGVYQGRYTINIPKDAWMANMDDNLDEHCILCGENYVSGCFRAAANINGSDWTDEIHDTVPATIKTRWNEVISFVMNATDEDFKANLNNYFYVDSLIDYYLFGLASCGLDAFGKNQLYMTYDGLRWIATMYDMDSTWGLYYTGARFVATDYGRNQYEDYVNSTGNLLYVRLEQLFYAEIQTRWAELRTGAMSYENIMTRFERFIGIVPPHIVKEDYASTTGGGSFTGIPSQSTNNIQQIRTFALARQAWTDEYVASLTPAKEIPCTGITLNQTTLTFTAAGTQTLKATVTPDGCTDAVIWSSENSSIASVNGGVVTAKANGSTTITATCGAYSATCAVSVSIATVELPDGYTAVEYICAGGYSYIDTGVTPTTDTGAEYKMRLDEVKTYGPHTLSSSETFFPVLRTANGIGLKRSGANLDVAGHSAAAGQTYEVSAFVGGDAVVLNGTEIVTLAAGTKTETTHLFIGAYGSDPGNQYYTLIGRIYYVKIYEADKLIRDYIPCVNSSNVAGLYDLVESKFYDSDGSVPFRIDGITLPEEGNLLSTASALTDNSIINGNTGEMVASNGGERACESYIPVNAGATYAYMTANSYNPNCSVRFYDADKNYLGSSTAKEVVSGSTFTAPSSSAYLRFHVWKAAGVTIDELGIYLIS